MRECGPRVPPHLLPLPRTSDLDDRLASTLEAAPEEEEEEGNEVRILSIPVEAREMIDADALAKLRGQSTDPDLDGHLGLCRIKAAAGLSILHGERAVSPLMWELSGVLMEKSQTTRKKAEKHHFDQQDRTNRARGKAEGTRSVEAGKVKADDALKRVSRSIQKVLVGLGGKGSRSEVRKKIAHRDRKLFDDALEALVDAGQVEVVRNSGGGENLVLTEDQ